MDFDLHATNAPESVDIFTQIDFPACYLIYGSMKFLGPEKNGDSTYYNCDFSLIDTALLMRDVALLNYSPIYSTPNVDEQVAFFNDAILQLFHGHVPLRRGCRKSNFNQWYNSEIEMAIVNCNLAYRSWKLERTTELRVIYKRFWNSVNSLVRQPKRGYMN
jgi:hypothetical protein